MKRGLRVLLRVGIGCAVVIGSAQATTLTPTVTYLGDTSWQNIGGVSYTFADANHDGLLEVGEKVTFTVDMQKENWGTHRYDALKVWIDDASVNLVTKDFQWYYDPTLKNMDWFNKPGDTYSWRPWTGGDKFFSFDYTFTKTGTFDLLASVMCSRDLSGLVGGADDNPTGADWNAWTENLHKTRWLQGEDKDYRLTVLAPPVPEPETYAMMMAGLGLMGAVVRRRKAKQ